MTDASTATHCTMHFFLLFILFLLFSSPLDCRPSRQMETNERCNRDVEYESENDATAEEYDHEEQEGQQMADDRDESRYKETVQNDDSYLKSDEVKRNTQNQPEPEKFSDDKNGREINEENEPDVNLEDDIPTPSDRRRANIDRETYGTDHGQAVKMLSSAARNRHNDEDEEADPKQRDMSYHSIANDEGQMLFKNRPNQKEIEWNRYNNECPTINGRQRSYNKYNAMQMNNKHIREEKRYEINNELERDRRQVQTVDEKQVDAVSISPNEKVSNAPDAVEDSETIIKNKIKKLSREELEDLLNSLAEDKKTILKKVIDEVTPNKREITKKAGASEENGLLENGQVDVRNLQGDCPSEANIDLRVSQSKDNTDSSLSNESNDSTSTKLPETEKSSEKTNSNSRLVETNTNDYKSDTDSSDTLVNIKNEDSLNGDSAKNDNKRETNLKQFSNNDLLQVGDNDHGTDYQESLLEESGICENNENYAEMENDELRSEKEADNQRNIRDCPIGTSNSIKSLQESFPAENAEPNLKSNLAPLIRVKRTDREPLNTKRNANTISNMKVPFIPDTENDNLENDERSEFEDYGIFDRDSHLTGSSQWENSEKSIKDSLSRHRRLKNVEDKNNLRTRNIDPNVENMSLGSDTDSVLTGVEGADENIMYNSVSRNKRKVEDPKVIYEDSCARIGRTTGPLEMDLVLENNNINSHETKDDEAFGPLARNFEEDITRYKRVREV